jgi:HPt (histidine-containing phosphotransfer) domain-containing protein
MIEMGLIEPVAAPPLSPVDRTIDLEHLSRMTLGDRDLERDVLNLFDRQADMLLVKMQDAVPAAIAAYAHTLKGSARGIGAWDVARAAHDIETAVESAQPVPLAPAMTRLTLAVGEARRAIADLLRTTEFSS